jgi:hypothetical protein
MKFIVLISCILLTCIFSKGQLIVNNFFIDNGDLKWQKVYELNTPIDSLNYFFTLNGYFEKVELSEESISENLRNIDVDIIGAGFKKGNMPMYTYHYSVSGFAFVESKPG